MTAEETNLYLSAMSECFRRLCAYRKIEYKGIWSFINRDKIDGFRLPFAYHLVMEELKETLPNEYKEVCNKPFPMLELV